MNFDTFCDSKTEEFEQLNEGFKKAFGGALAAATLGLSTVGAFADSRGEAIPLPSTMYEKIPDDVGNMSKQLAVNIIARTLYAEARGEGNRGIEAVASVIYNRAGGIPKNMPLVCLKYKQFSCWNGLPDEERDGSGIRIRAPKGTARGKNKEIWKICNEVAIHLMRDLWDSTVKSSNSYYNPQKANPDWGKQLRDPIVLGNHLFGYLPEHDGFKKRGESTETNESGR